MGGEHFSKNKGPITFFCQWKGSRPVHIFFLKLLWSINFINIWKMLFILHYLLSGTPIVNCCLVLNVLMNGSCFSMCFEEAGRVVFLKTQLLIMLHHHPPYDKVFKQVYITPSMATNKSWLRLLWYLTVVGVFWFLYMHV